VANYFQIAPATLSAPSKERNIVRTKAVICHVAVRKLGVKGIDVAASLGYSSTAVTQAAKRGEALLAADRDLEKMLGKIKKL
jgi:chromosomal replication initiation ATPase DnaA